MKRVGSLIALGLMMALFHSLAEAAPVEARATLAVGFLVLAAYLGGQLGQRIGLPLVAAYLIVGVGVGPGWAALVQPDEVAALRFFGDAAVTLIAFAAGGALKLDFLKTERVALTRITLGAMVVPFVAVTVVTLTVSPWFPLTAGRGGGVGDTLAVALVLGALAAVASPVVTMGVIGEYGTEGKDRFAATILGTTVAQDVAALILFAAIGAVAEILTAGGGVRSDVIWPALGRLVGSPLAGVGLGFAVSHYRGREAPLFLIGLGLVVAALARLAGLEPILVALAAGFYLANYGPARENRLLQTLEAGWLPLYAVIFALAGASVDVSALRELWPWVLLLVGLRFWGIKGGLRWAARNPAVTDDLARYGWLCLVSQAGVAVALAGVARRSFPAWGISLEAMVLVVIAVNQLVGPIAFRQALRRLERLPVAALLAAVLVFAACGGEEDLRPASMNVVSGSGQQGPAGFRLAEPMVVEVRDQFGNLLPRARINWAVTSGAGASVNPTFSVTNGLGRASADLTLGPTVGAYGVTAVAAGASNVTAGFTADATDAPTLTDVTPASFSGGDTLTLSGTGFTSGAVVEVGAQFARVLTTSATTLTAIAPACLAPGSVDVRVRVGLATTGSQSRTYTADVINLLPGEYTAVDPAQVAGCASFASNISTDTIEYLLVPQASTGTPDQSQLFQVSSVQVVGSALAAAPSSPAAMNEADRFHFFLREEEGRLSRLPRPARPLQAPSLAPPVLSPPAVGSTRQFKVCATTTCATFDNVTATVKYVGTHAAIYVDNTAPSNGFTQADYDSIGALFDQRLYGVDADAFGVESDIDENGVVIILLTATVNRLIPEPTCNTSFIAGFFFAFDLDPTAEGDARSNRGEIFYTLVPDPSGSITCAYSNQLMQRLIPVTFIHEFQHMISYNEHVLVRNGSAEIVWLNEGLSHFAEELGGRSFLPADNAAFSRFVIGDLFNGYQFMNTPGAASLVYQGSLGSLAERGANWLFVRYLADRFGPGVTRRLVQTNLRGAANVEAQTGDLFGRLVNQWALTLWVSDLPGFTAPAELKYTSWDFRTTYASLNSQNPSSFPQPYPLIPIIATSGACGASGMAFTCSGTMKSGSGVFMRVRQPPAGSGFALSFVDGSGNPFATNNPAVPRLNIIRTR
jgi:Kef-type K+ transport system membrane component KefB